MTSKWRTKFQSQQGKWIFVPTQECLDIGKEIKSGVENTWEPPHYFFHLRQGGHVKALQHHLPNKYFLHLDIQDFFGSINKSRVTRALKNKVGYQTAREWAKQSTVRDPEDKQRFILPFGFVQSQILATLCLSRSALGTCFRRLAKRNDISLSVYVDDIIVSSNEMQHCDDALRDLAASAEQSRFFLNRKKQEGPANSIKAFNIILSHGNLTLTDDRISKFKQQIEEDLIGLERRGILSYVRTVNNDQFLDLQQHIQIN